MASNQSDDIWNHWKKNLETSDVSCIYCYAKHTKHATRMKGHTSKCTRAPRNVRNFFQEKLPPSVSRKKPGFGVPSSSSTCATLAIEEKAQDTLNSSAFEIADLIDVEMDESAVNSASNAAVVSLSSLKQTTLTGTVNRLSASKLKELQLQFVKAMVSGSIPFNWLTDPYLQAFFKSLQSGFIPPARREASGTLLNALELESSNYVKEILKKEQHFSLIPDGWTNVKGLSVLNIMLANPNVCVFIRSIETGEIRQTGDYIKAQLAEILEEMCESYGLEKICAIVSDQGANILKAREDLAREKDQIISINCAAHLLNLLAGDFCKFPSVQLIINQAKHVVKEIKNSKVKLGAFHAEFKRYIAEQKELGHTGVTEITLYLPCVTRWLGLRLMIEKLQRAKPVLERMAIAENTLLATSVKGIIKSDIFWDKINNTNQIILALTDGIQVVQSQNACISDVVEEFLKLREIFTEEGSNFHKLQSALDTCELEKAKTVYLNRSADRCISLHHYVANLLDPRYRGERFQSDSRRKMQVLGALESYAHKVGVAITLDDKLSLGSQLTSFTMRSDFFATNMLNHPVPLLFWQNYLQFPETRLLAQIGCRLLSIPASSAGVERSFSTQGYIHSKSRNRLGEVKMDKLMRIKWSLRDQAESTQCKTSAKKKDEAFELHLTEENDEADIDELIRLDDEFTEEELHGSVVLNVAAANSSTEAANPTTVLIV